MMRNKSKVLIVGTGFSGATVARRLAEANIFVDIIDKRNHIGGNAFDFVNEYGIRQHKYGPHIFHTNNQKVYDFLSEFTEWEEYKHKVKAVLSNGQYVTLPVNLETSSIVGKDKVVDVFIKPYTKKMWGLELDQIDPEVVNRVRIREDNNVLYFPDDKYQFMPRNGYTELIKNMLSHNNININISCDFRKSMETNYDFVFNSMPIDEYFDYCYGELPYRSIKFHSVNLPTPLILPTTTVNFTHDGPYTRVTEWKQFPRHGENSCFTTLTYEEPCDYRDNEMERYYPVKDIDGNNRKLFKEYLKVTPPNMRFIGRCGLYSYLDMHQAISSALAISDEFLNTKG
jgi:UDP-galactopyranose mutase